MSGKVRTSGTCHEMNNKDSESVVCQSARMRSTRILAPLSIYLGLVPSAIFIATVLPHLWAGATRHICISSNRAHMGRTSGEVMVERIVASAARRVGAARVTAVSGDNSIIITRRRLPINGLESVLELLRATELPLAEDGPENGNTSDGGSDSDEDGHDITRSLGSSSHLGSRSLFSSDRCDQGLGGFNLGCVSFDLWVGRGWFGSSRRG